MLKSYLARGLVIGNPLFWELGETAFNLYLTVWIWTILDSSLGWYTGLDEYKHNVYVDF